MATVYHYNPDLLGDGELRRQFVVRTGLLESLGDALRVERPAHHLVIGQRGMGKTTLLRRLHLLIRDDPALSARWLPLAFPEEQYNVASLADFWLNCADALADTMERAGRRDVAAKLDERIAALGQDGSALELLLDVARAEDKGLVLLVDNLDIVLSRLDERNQWALRTALGGSLPLVVIGASADLHTETAEYGKPFYEFLQIVTLDPLSWEEMGRLLRSLLAGRGGDPDTLSQGRIRALHALTGGNVRTAGFIVELLAESPTLDVETHLNALLDRVTPLYKDRFESLPEQLQRVLDALALGWEPMTAAALSHRLNLPVNHVSAQLARLATLGFVEVVKLPRSRRQGFQVAERFFNVWYLMRASRRLRSRLGHLARFMEAIWGNDERIQLAQRLLTAPASLETVLALSQTQGVRDTAEARALMHQRLRAHNGSLREYTAHMAELVDLRKAGRAVLDTMTRERLVRETRELAFAANAEWTRLGTDTATGWRVLSELWAPWGFKREFAAALPDLDCSDWVTLTARAETAYTLGPLLAEHAGEAARDGVWEGPMDVEGEQTAVALGNPWPAIAGARWRTVLNPKRPVVSTIPSAALRRALVQARAARDVHALTTLAVLHQEQGEAAEARKAWAFVWEFEHPPRLDLAVASWCTELSDPAEARRIVREAASTDQETEALLAWAKYAPTLHEQMQAADRLAQLAPERADVQLLAAESALLRLDIDAARASLAKADVLGIPSDLQARADGIRTLLSSSTQTTQTTTTSFSSDDIEHMLTKAETAAEDIFDVPLVQVILAVVAPVLAAAGRSQFVLDLLHRHHLADRLAPLHHALRIHEAGDRTLLDELAPEMRLPTAELLDRVDRVASAR